MRWGRGINDMSILFPAPEQSGKEALLIADIMNHSQKTDSEKGL